MDRETRLPPRTTSAGAARRFVARELTSFGLAEAAEVAALLVSELVTNAVLHARTDISLRLRTNARGVRVEVGDRGGGTAVLRSYGPEASTGRGLLLVEELADAWGTDDRPVGKVVWFELAGSGERAGALSETRV